MVFTPNGLIDISLNCSWLQPGQTPGFLPEVSLPMCESSIYKFALTDEKSSLLDAYDPIKDQNEILPFLKAKETVEDFIGEPYAIQSVGDFWLSGGSKRTTYTWWGSVANGYGWLPEITPDGVFELNSIVSRHEKDRLSLVKEYQLILESLASESAKAELAKSFDSRLQILDVIFRVASGVLKKVNSRNKKPDLRLSFRRKSNNIFKSLDEEDESLLAITLTFTTMKKILKNTGYNRSKSYDFNSRTHQRFAENTQRREIN